MKICYISPRRVGAMNGTSCPACSGRFGLFKRKRNCSYCNGCFCSDCLVKEGKMKWCQLCGILVRTPYDRDALLKLGVKHLLAFLQRKHVSTFGCSEKRDLVDLIFENFGRNSYPAGGFPADSLDTSRFPSQSASSHGPQHDSAAASTSSAANPDPHSHSQPTFATDDGIRVRGNDDVAMAEESSDDEAELDGTVDDGIRVRPASGLGDGPEEESRAEQPRSPPSETNHDFSVEQDEDQQQAEERVGEPSVPTEDASMEGDEYSIATSSNSGLFGRAGLNDSVGPTVPVLTEEPKLNRFPSVSDLKTLEQVDGLSVRECKELLSLYRVEFKGVCEKSELLAKVKELWLERQRAKAEASELPDDELCRICMDSRIDCVLLDCGHMISCTLCGKKMNECPICRQYVVRVVHVFRT